MERYLFLWESGTGDAAMGMCVGQKEARKRPWVQKPLQEGEGIGCQVIKGMDSQGQPQQIKHLFLFLTSILYFGLPTTWLT